MSLLEFIPAVSWTRQQGKSGLREHGALRFAPRKQKERKKLPPLLKDVERNMKTRGVTAVPANRDLKDTNAHNLCSQWHFHWSQSPK